MNFLANHLVFITFGMIGLNYLINKSINWMMFGIWVGVFCIYFFFYMFSGFMFANGTPKYSFIFIPLGIATIPYIIYLGVRLYQSYGTHINSIGKDFWYISFPVLLSIITILICFYFDTVDSHKGEEGNTQGKNIIEQR